MTEIQKQAEQFRDSYLQHIGIGHLAEQNYYDLLYSIVKECSRVTDEWLTIDTFRPDEAKYASPDDAILGHFAWLEKK